MTHWARHICPPRGSPSRDRARRVRAAKPLNCAAVSWIMTLWDRPPIRRTMYATSFLVLFFGLIVFVNNRDQGSAAPGPIVPGSPSQLQLDYGSPIALPNAAKDVAKQFIHGAVLRE